MTPQCADEIQPGSINPPGHDTTLCLLHTAGYGCMLLDRDFILSQSKIVPNLGKTKSTMQGSLITHYRPLLARHISGLVNLLQPLEQHRETILNTYINAYKQTNKQVR